MGVTGTRSGLSAKQRSIAIDLLRRMHRDLNFEFLHHGDCVGVDAQIDAIAKEVGFQTILHPPDNAKYRAHTSGHAAVNLPLPYLDRNKRMVGLVELLVAFPYEESEVLRSGTWATIRWARRQDVVVMTVYPSGRVAVEES